MVARPPRSTSFEAVIGLEIHVQLATRTKLFCADRTDFGAPPNTQVCPVCLGLPGALPALNGAAVDLAVRAALGLACTVHERSAFVRKHYFYPDLPKGYQITQRDTPLATDGAVTFEGEAGTRRTRIRRLHLEEDAGRLVHDRVPNMTAIDLNRAGVALIEIVTDPDIASPADARAFLNMLQRTLRYLEVSDCDMEKGSLRVDANVSLCAPGSDVPGARTELKNLNSFQGVERALAFEIDRQTEVLLRGERVEPATMRWDAEAGVAMRLRSKEEEQDYRFLDDPDVPLLVLAATRIAAIRHTLPELPADRARRFVTDYGVSAYEAAVLTAEASLADYFEGVTAALGEAKLASNWTMVDVLAWSNACKRPVAEFPLAPTALAGLLRLVRNGTVSQRAARQTVLPRMLATGEDAAAAVDAAGVGQVSDTVQLGRWVEEVIAAHADAAQRYAAGDERVLGYLMGRLMQQSQGRADPRRAAALFAERLRP